jgi:hypothetical protein
MELTFFLGCLLVLVVVFYFSREIRNEGFMNVKESFGMSPGTLDQLASTRVAKPQIIDPNRRPDQDVNDLIQSNLTNKAIAELSPSGSDDRYASA